VLLFTWDTHVRDGSSSRYFVAINFLVHSVMYTYYAAMALGVKSVSTISIMITSMQIVQMAIGEYMCMSYSIGLKHAIMHAIVSFSYHLCFYFSFSITTGMFVLLRVNSLIGSGDQCSDSTFTVLTGLTMYASYFILFANFFIKRYVIGSASRKQQQEIRKKM
jgi:hypothetical protein